MLKTLREEKGLANKTKVERTYIVKLEKNPSLDILKKLAKALGVPVTELLG